MGAKQPALTARTSRVCVGVITVDSRSASPSASTRIKDGAKPYGAVLLSTEQIASSAYIAGKRQSIPIRIPVNR